MNYIKYLSEINSTFCKDSEIRTKDITHLKKIEEAYNDAIVSEDYGTVLNRAIYVAALIKLYQPFFDGNNRTALVAYKDILLEKGIGFDYEKASEDMKEHKLAIPTLFDSDEKINDVYDWFSYIDYKENKGRKYKYEYMG